MKHTYSGKHLNHISFEVRPANKAAALHGEKFAIYVNNKFVINCKTKQEAEQKVIEMQNYLKAPNTI